MRADPLAGTLQKEETQILYLTGDGDGPDRI